MFPIINSPFKELGSRRNFEQVFKLQTLSSIAIFVAACGTTQADSLADHSLSTWQSCAPPCWYGLEIGKSNLEEVLATLQRLPFVDPSSVQNYDDVTSSPGDEKITTVTWDCLHPKRRFCGNAYLSGNTLVSLWMSVNFDLTFNETVQKFGSPNYVGYNSIYWVGSCEVILSWPGKGMTISGRVLPKACPTREGAEKKQKPNPNIKVNYVTFGLPEDFHSDAEFPIFYVPWRGFGEGPLLFWDFIPGDLPMWIVLLGSVIVLILLAIWNRRWPSAAISFPLAAAATFLPTLQFQFSDVCIPTIVSYGINTLICGFVFIGIAEGVRFAWRRNHHVTGR